MKRYLLSIVVIAFFAAAGLAQSRPTLGKPLRQRETNKVHIGAAKRSSVLSKPIPYIKVPTLDQLHDTLRRSREPHDTYLYIAPVGNEQSVPLLLERFRLDYGTSEPPPGATYGFTDTKEHLVDALRYIANVDQGMFYPRWSAWWAANRHLPQHQWMLDGFAAKGMHVVEPVDEQFGLELIEALGRGHNYHDYLAFNARRFLAGVPSSPRAKWVARASVSEQRFLRLGAIRVLSQIDTTGHEDILRTLATDWDLEIRREALTTLNEHLRTSLRTEPADARNLLRADGTNRIKSISFAGEVLCVIFYDNEVQAFDLHTFRKLWSRHIFPGPGDGVLAVKNHLVLATHDGGVLALNQQGRVLWRRMLGGEKNRILRLVQYKNDVFVVCHKSIVRLNSQTGVTKSTIPAIDFISDADSSETLAVFADGSRLRSLLNGTGVEQPFSTMLGVSVSQHAVCMTSGQSDSRVTCLTPDTQSLLWTHSITETGAGGVAPIQSGTRVFVPTEQDLTAFGATDGAILWTASGGQEAYRAIVPTPYGLLVPNSRLGLDLRDSQTGEVRSVWSQMTGIAHLAVHRNFVAASDIFGGLWIVDLSKTGGHRLQKSDLVSVELSR